ncbi:MAG: sulfatase-like hydrolase/transferase [Thermoguttaceae bacterium]
MTSSFISTVFATLCTFCVLVLFAPTAIADSSDRVPENSVVVNALQRPNILLILTDDLGIGDLACYGAPDTQSPNLDRLALEGMLFTSCRANSSVCSPSRAAMLSGMFSDRTGVPGVLRTEHAPTNSWGWLSEDVDLISQLLLENGYRTALVGKWHLGMESPNQPNDRGFQLFRGFQCGMLDDYDTHLRFGVNPLRHNKQQIRAKGHITDVFTNWAIEYLEQQGKEQQFEEERGGIPSPFFLWLSYNAPHCPIHPDPAWIEKVRKRNPDMLELRLKYLALIEHLDDAIGRVLQTLEMTGLAENTIVVFSSDNGGVLKYGGRIGDYRGEKGTMYDGGLRVPLLVKWPGHIQAGSRSDENAVLMDLFPTFLDMTRCYFQPRQRIDGVSLVPLLTGETSTLPERELYFLRREGDAVYFGSTIESVILGDWKLVHNTPSSPLELFHLREDPNEQNDLSKVKPKEFDRARRSLQRHIQQGGQTPWYPPAHIEQVPSWDE